MKSKNLVGIDLGTTFSSLNCLDADLKPRPVANAEGEFVTPSVVYFRENGGGPIVGRDAIELGLNRPDRFVVHAKRYLGEPHACWEIDGVMFTPVDISAFILRKLIEDAEEEIGAIEEAVVTVPAHFTSHQRQLTIEAGKQAGLKSVAVVNEPVAAALCYALGEDGLVMTHWIDEFIVLVYDLGGGTFDLSLVRYDSEQLRVLGVVRHEHKQLRVLAASGERRLGGIDWDQCLVDRVADTFALIHGIDLREEEQTLQRLAYRVQLAKHALSNPRINSTEFLVQCKGIEEAFSLTREEFEELTGHLVQRTHVLTEQLLKTAHLTWDQIDRLIPVGGSTRMPMIRRLLDSMAAQGTVIHHLAPDLSVAQGAALFAGIINSQDRGELAAQGLAGGPLANYSTKIVTANSLGVIVRRNDGQRVNYILIPKNTPLPASASVAVGTYRPNQSRIKVKIVEGDTGMVGQTTPVCHCTIDQLPPRLPSGSLFDLNLAYDADGLLQVSVTHRDSGRVGSVSTLYAPG